MTFWDYIAIAVMLAVAIIGSAFILVAVEKGNDE